MGTIFQVICTNTKSPYKSYVSEGIDDKTWWNR